METFTFEMLKLFKVVAVNAFGLKDHDLNSLKNKFGQSLLFVCVRERACAQERKRGRRRMCVCMY